MNNISTSKSRVNRNLRKMRTKGNSSPVKIPSGIARQRPDPEATETSAIIRAQGALKQAEEQEKMNSTQVLIVKGPRQLCDGNTIGPQDLNETRIVHDRPSHRVEPIEDRRIASNEETKSAVSKSQAAGITFDARIDHGFNYDQSSQKRIQTQSQNQGSIPTGGTHRAFTEAVSARSFIVRTARLEDHTGTLQSEFTNNNNGGLLSARPFTSKDLSPRPEGHLPEEGFKRPSAVTGLASACDAGFREPQGASGHGIDQSLLFLDLSKLKQQQDENNPKTLESVGSCQQCYHSVLNQIKSERQSLRQRAKSYQKGSFEDQKMKIFRKSQQQLDQIKDEYQELKKDSERENVHINKRSSERSNHRKRSSSFTSTQNKFKGSILGGDRDTRNVQVGAVFGNITSYKKESNGSFTPKRSYSIYENLKLAHHKSTCISQEKQWAEKEKEINNQRRQRSRSGRMHSQSSQNEYLNQIQDWNNRPQVTPKQSFQAMMDGQEKVKSLVDRIANKQPLIAQFRGNRPVGGRSFVHGVTGGQTDRYEVCWQFEKNQNKNDITRQSVSSGSWDDSEENKDHSSPLPNVKSPTKLLLQDSISGKIFSDSSEKHRCQELQAPRLGLQPMGAGLTQSRPGGEGEVICNLVYEGESSKPQGFSIPTFKTPTKFEVPSKKPKSKKKKKSKVKKGATFAVKAKEAKEPNRPLFANAYSLHQNIRASSEYAQDFTPAGGDEFSQRAISNSKSKHYSRDSRVSRQSRRKDQQLLHSNNTRNMASEYSIWNPPPRAHLSSSKNTLDHSLQVESQGYNLKPSTHHPGSAALGDHSHQISHQVDHLYNDEHHNLPASSQLGSKPGPSASRGRSPDYLATPSPISGQYLQTQPSAPARERKLQSSMKENRTPGSTKPMMATMRPSTKMMEDSVVDMEDSVCHFQGKMKSGKNESLNVGDTIPDDYAGYQVHPPPSTQPLQEALSHTNGKRKKRGCLQSSSPIQRRKILEGNTQIYKQKNLNSNQIMREVAKKRDKFSGISSIALTQSQSQNQLQPMLRAGSALNQVEDKSLHSSLKKQKVNSTKKKRQGKTPQNLRPSFDDSVMTSNITRPGQPPHQMSLTDTTDVAALMKKGGQIQSMSDFQNIQGILNNLNQAQQQQLQHRIPVVTEASQTSNIQVSRKQQKAMMHSIKESRVSATLIHSIADKGILEEETEESPEKKQEAVNKTVEVSLR